jgi:hypothetical protein
VGKKTCARERLGQGKATLAEHSEAAVEIIRNTERGQHAQEGLVVRRPSGGRTEQIYGKRRVNIFTERLQRSVSVGAAVARKC